MSAACLRVGGTVRQTRSASRGKSSTEKIKFLQLNTQHTKQAQHKINRWIDKQKEKDYIVLVQEPYLYKNKRSIQPLTANKYYAKNTNSRTAIYTSKSSNAWMIEHLSNMDATVIVSRIKNRTTVVASHLVSHCPRLEETRKEIFLDKIFGHDHTWSIRRLMEFIRLPVITRMLTSKTGALLKDVSLTHI